MADATAAERELREQYQKVISQKRDVLKEIYKLQSQVAELDEEIGRIAGAGSVACYW
jgi:predicted nuclease with TOPRIM domain